MNDFADLHLHSSYSDGSYSPDKIVDLAKKFGFKAIAIVDHDTVAGVDEAVTKAKADNSLEVIPGVELNLDINDHEIHIIGLFVDYKNKNLLEALDKLCEYRRGRIRKIVKKLHELGIRININNIFEMSKGGALGRLHVAHALVKENIVKNLWEAFNQYIGKDRPAYVKRSWINTKEAIKIISDAGGIPIFAHPSLTKMDEIIPQLIKEGLMGLEAFHNSHNHEATNHYINLAKKYNLLITGGSDCHGEMKSHVLMGSIKLPYKYVQDLKNRYEKITHSNLLSHQN